MYSISTRVSSGQLVSPSGTKYAWSNSASQSQYLSCFHFGSRVAPP